MSAAIEITHLNFSYLSHQILNNISLNVKKSECFIILGPNGSGKTTLMKIMTGINKHRDGLVNIFDKPVQKYSRIELARIIAYVPQINAMEIPFTVREFVLMGRSPYLGLLGIESKTDIEIANQAIQFTDIEPLADRPVTQLSGGEFQRVLIAKAICQEPSIILLDEPTASLDLAHQVHVMDLMKKLKTKKGVTTVMVSHDINLSSMYADHLLLLKNGKIICIGPCSEVLKKEILEETYGCQLNLFSTPQENYTLISPVPNSDLDSDLDSESQ